LIQNHFAKTEGQNTPLMIKSQLKPTISQPGRAPAARLMKVRSVSDSRRALVPLDQPAELFMADDLIEDDRLVFRRRVPAGGWQELSGGVRSAFVLSLRKRSGDAAGAKESLGKQRDVPGTCKEAR